MFTVDQVLTDYYPALSERKRCTALLKPILRRLLHEASFLEFAENYPHLQGIEFIEQVFEYFNFSYTVSDREREHIPVTGSVVIIANHPIGSLDGLALLKLVHEVRSDVKIVVNDLLHAIAPLRGLLLPVPVLTGSAGRRHIQRIQQALAEGTAVIFFPAGEVSRLAPHGIKDGPWQHGFLSLAERAKAPILPIHIAARNSGPFYLASTLAKPLSTLMLVGQMFYQREKQIKITIGSLIPYRAYRALPLPRSEKVGLFKKHLYRIGSGKRTLLQTESAIARPERRSDLKKAMEHGEQLGITPDGKTIYRFTGAECPVVLREIGRLRELTFRSVGEGSGKRRDIDRFDRYYEHLILWDEDDLEIAGAYRFVDAGRALRDNGPDGIYSCSLFTLDPADSAFLNSGLELGRSFVQQRYWGKRSLDYLWYGIGAFLRSRPHYRYLFGPVSISNDMPQLAKELLISFYRLYFSAAPNRDYSRKPFVFSQSPSAFADTFSGRDYRQDFTRLKLLLNNLGTTVPPLYKQYTELCEPGGVIFLDFNVDPDFNNCVDGLVIVDTQLIRQSKRKRYMEESILV
ncbi:lysophospholipid acyltransferase family protein [bacterium]|nr:lysophospholipid acyltransferase family protein [bacterium]